MPLDPIDFDNRYYLPGSGWPISLSDLAPYYPEANALSEAGDFIYDADDVFDPLSQGLFKGFTSPTVRTNSLERFSCPTDFAVRYEKRLRLAKDIRVVLGANCTSISLASDGTQVREIKLASLSGNRFTAAARSVVLAVGGIETARLLLASRDVRPAGIGNENDLVGRYYMCHIAGNVGALTINGPTSNVRHGYEISPEGIYCRRRLSLTEDTQRSIGVGNMVARLHFPSIADPSHGNGVLSGLFMAKHFISYEYGKRLNDGKQAGIGTYARHLLNIVADPWDATSFAYNWLTKRTLAQRKFPSVILRNKTNRFSLEIHSEQIPSAASRISLCGAHDELGVPKVRIDWRYLPEDIESVRRTLNVFSGEFMRTGIGRFEFDPNTLEEGLTRFGAYGGHHIGTTRMGADPDKSVVDRNCRLHSVNNLFIASSAVFPTSGQANPTLTITALALRLADHLARSLGASKSTETMGLPS
jgi:choline dehydrogenase-like flavoprotein